MNNFFEDDLLPSDRHYEYVDRGYNHDSVPKIEVRRQTSTLNYFTLWMGSIHNIPNYTAIGGFVFLGLSGFSIMVSILIAGVVLALFMVLNGRVGSKYGIPFSMHLRSTYGDLGAKLPGFLRGVVAAIAWFGLQNYTGSLALLVIVSKIWPGFLELGAGITILGIGIPGLISFTLFWALNLMIGIGGGKILNKFTAILNPLIYIVFGGMALWAIKNAGLGNILSYQMDVSSHYPLVVGMLMVINIVISGWAPVLASVSDFTQFAKSTKDQVVGQIAGFSVGYLVFALSSISILIGGSLIYGVTEWNIVEIINKWDSLYLSIVAMLVLLMTTISTNATGNIIPAGYQLSALFPKRLNYKKAVVLAGVISYIILPWKLMEESSSIFFFLNAIGAVIGPITGVMLVHFYFLNKQTIDIDALYFDQENTTSKYHGINKNAYIATFVGIIAVLLGTLVPSLKILSDLAWIVSLVLSGLSYYVLSMIGGRKNV